MSEIEAFFFSQLRKSILFVQCNTNYSFIHSFIHQLSNKTSPYTHTHIHTEKNNGKVPLLLLLPS